ncbi:MAG: hypothetical protein AABY15_04665 [Nanoarchaeota archaeon]
MSNKPVTNSVDIAMQKVRQLQQMIYDHSKSANDLFKFTNEIIKDMENASQEIKANYEEISKKLTEKMSTGKG